jgi:aspartyl-tRNA(Asn)/glutamyl-tRNA(Gln) amidotransferase subunit A
LPWAADRGGPPNFAPFTGFANAAGLPGLSIPCGFSPDGLPVGFQIVGPLGADWLLLAVARAYERAYPWAHLWPEMELGM